MEYKEKSSYKIEKRLLDIVGGIVGSILAVIIIVVCKVISVANGDYYPILFKQQRIGQYGNPIIIYKIRSMIPNAEAELEKLMANDPAIREEYLTNKKLQNDPRVTPLGNYIRRKSLDEFPQFFNVLMGNMSMVGPRPYLYREIPDMGDGYEEIIKVKPGITGPWQTGGRSDTDFPTRVAYDVGYVGHHDIKSDIRMIYATLFGHGGGAR